MMSKNKYEFYSNEALGVTVAKMSREDFFKAIFNTAMRKILKGTKNTSLDTSDWCCNISDYAVSYFYEWQKKFNFDKNVITRARCNFEDGDQFDETIGRYIAEDRMDVKIADYAIRFLDDLWLDLDTLIDDMVDRRSKLCDFANHTEEHTRNLTSSESCGFCKI